MSTVLAHQEKGIQVQTTGKSDSFRKSKKTEEEEEEEEDEDFAGWWVVDAGETPEQSRE